MARTQKNKATSFVLDEKSFLKQDLDRRQDYFALDFYMTLNSPELLGEFQAHWRQARDLATTQTGILSFGMGVNVSSDNKTLGQLSNLLHRSSTLNICGTSEESADSFATRGRYRTEGPRTQREP